ncbi:MAG: hypothetical protein ACR5K9_05730 [Wolbachia sp.]
MKVTKENTMKTREEFVEAQNGMLVQKIVMSNPKSNIDEGKKKHTFQGLHILLKKSQMKTKVNGIGPLKQVWMFTLSGSGKSEGHSLNGQNRVNAGIEVISDLLKRGIHP